MAAKDDPTQGMVKYLLSIPVITSAVGAFDDGTPWIFQDSLFKTIESTQQAAIVVTRTGGWAAPNEYNSAEFPRMQVNFYVDPARDAANNVTSKGEARRRAYELYKIVDPYLHLKRGTDSYWGDIRVIGSHRINEFDISIVPEGDGVLRGACDYALTLG